MNSLVRVKRGNADGGRTEETWLTIYMFLGSGFVLSQCKWDGTGDVISWEGSACVLRRMHSKYSAFSSTWSTLELREVGPIASHL